MKPFLLLIFLSLAGCQDAPPMLAPKVDLDPSHVRPMLMKLRSDRLVRLSSISSNTVKLAWNPSPSIGVVDYIIYQGTNSGHYLLSNSVGNVTTSTMPVIPGVLNYFAFSAKTDNGLESRIINEISYLPAKSGQITLWAWGKIPSLPGAALWYFGNANVDPPAVDTWWRLNVSGSTLKFEQSLDFRNWQNIYSLSNSMALLGTNFSLTISR